MKRSKFDWKSNLLNRWANNFGQGDIKFKVETSVPRFVQKSLTSTTEFTQTELRHWQYSRNNEIKIYITNENTDNKKQMSKRNELIIKLIIKFVELSVRDKW